MMSTSYFQMVKQEGNVCMYTEEMEWVFQGKTKVVIHCHFSFNFSMDLKVSKIEKCNQFKEFLKTYYCTISK